MAQRSKRKPSTPELATGSFEIRELPRVKVTPSPEQIRASTARYIAYALVAGFLLFLGLPFAFLVTAPKPTLNATANAVNQTIDLIKTVSAVLSGLVGSVVMYYFSVEKKAQTNQTNQTNE